jgi:hypothetical protein
MADFIFIMKTSCWETHKTEYLLLATPKAIKPQRKFTIRYFIYNTKATTEEDGPLIRNEFQDFIFNSPTTVVKNDIH